MKNILSHKKVLITGANGGLGVAIAKELATLKCHLFLTARNRSSLEQLASDLHEISPEVEIFSADLTKEIELKELEKKVRSTFQSIDILINCAGVFPVASISESTLEEFDACFALNVRAPFFLSKAFLPDMMTRQWGRVVNIGSSSAFSGFKDTSIYCASKHALLGLSRALYQEMRDSNVRVISINPGSIKTEMGKKSDDQEFSTFLNPEDIAKYLAFSIAIDSELIAEEIRLNRFVIR
ncbi:MAG: SDR family oxidoreductase [Chthoniobacterales bacterium]|nr:SDR family oxidoreductase [Chthoniobacterales bacterium]